MGRNMAKGSRQTHTSILRILPKRWAISVSIPLLFDIIDLVFRYMVSPWQQNGNALIYVKLHDKNVDHRRLVCLFLQLLYNELNTT